MLFQPPFQLSHIHFNSFLSGTHRVANCCWTWVPVDISWSVLFCDITNLPFFMDYNEKLSSPAFSTHPYCNSFFLYNEVQEWPIQRSSRKHANNAGLPKRDVSSHQNQVNVKDACISIMIASVFCLTRAREVISFQQDLTQPTKTQQLMKDMRHTSVALMQLLSPVHQLLSLCWRSVHKIAGIVLIQVWVWKTMSMLKPLGKVLNQVLIHCMRVLIYHLFMIRLLIPQITSKWLTVILPANGYCFLCRTVPICFQKLFQDDSKWITKAG